MKNKLFIERQLNTNWIVFSVFFLVFLFSVQFFIRSNVLFYQISSFILLIFVFLSFFQNKFFQKDIFRLTFKFSEKFIFFIFFVIFCGGMIIRIVLINNVPISISTADMLPLILKALGSFSHHEFPYIEYQFPYEMPLTFLPGLWLSYYPAFILNLDIRYTNLIIWFFISLIFTINTIYKIRKTNNYLFFFPALIIFLFFSFSIDFISFTTFGHTFPLWLWLIILWSSLIYEKPYISAIFLGLCIVSRQTYLIFLPWLFFYWLNKYGFKKSLQLGFISALFFLLVSFPFLIKNAFSVLIQPIIHYQSLAEWDISRGPESFTAHTFGISYLVQSVFSDKVLSLINLLIFIISSISAIFLSKNVINLVFYSLNFSFLFFMTTPIPWTYIYYPLILILGFTIFFDNKKLDYENGNYAAAI